MVNDDAFDNNIKYIVSRFDCAFNSLANDAIILAITYINTVQYW